jgi:hypothetical protein
MAVASRRRTGVGRKAVARKRASADQLAEMAGLAQGHVAAAVKTLAEIASNGQSEASRVSAAIALLDRGYGRPAQAVDRAHSGAPGSDRRTELSDAELTEIARGTAKPSAARRARRAGS